MVTRVPDAGRHYCITGESDELDPVLNLRKVTLQEGHQDSVLTDPDPLSGQLESWTREWWNPRQEATYLVCTEVGYPTRLPNGRKRCRIGIKPNSDLVWKPGEALSRKVRAVNRMRVILEIGSPQAGNSDGAA